MGQVPYELIGTGTWNQCWNHCWNQSDLKSINFCTEKGHRGNITVYLDRIHQYLCPVKFL